MKRETVTFTADKLKEFRKAYQWANAASIGQFSFDGRIYNTDYAKYLIEYLEMQLKVS